MGLNLEYIEKKNKEIMTLTENIEKIESMIESASDDQERQKLEEMKQEILFEIEENYLKKRLQKEGLSEELIRDFASLASRRKLLSKPETEKEPNKYNLSSEFIISNKTGENINVKYMSMSDKIKTIYEHTGEVISHQDFVLVNSRDNACMSFVKYLEKTMNKKMLQEKYGDNWQEEVERLYKKGYDDYMKYYISKCVEEIDNKDKKVEVVEPIKEEKKDEKIQKLTEENRELTSALTVANSTIIRLTEENKELSEKVETLSGRIVEIQQSHKADMEALKSGIVEISKASTEIKPEVIEEEVSYGTR